MYIILIKKSSVTQAAFGTNMLMLKTVNYILSI
jgi:hypothetical protein